MNYNEIALEDKITRSKKQIKLLRGLEIGIKLLLLVIKIQAVVFRILIKLFTRQEKLLLELWEVSRNNEYFAKAGMYRTQKEFYESLLGAIK